MKGNDLSPCAQWTAKCVYILLLVTASSAMGAMMLPTVQRQLQAAFRDFRATCTDLNILGRDLKKTVIIDNSPQVIQIFSLLFF